MDSFRHVSMAVVTRPSGVINHPALVGLVDDEALQRAPTPAAEQIVIFLTRHQGAAETFIDFLKCDFQDEGVISRGTFLQQGVHCTGAFTSEPRLWVLKVVASTRHVTKNPRMIQRTNNRETENKLFSLLEVWPAQECSNAGQKCRVFQRSDTLG